jgi:hypothetical protein
MKTQPWFISGLVSILCLSSVVALAQAPRSPFEVGGQVSTLRVGDPGNTNAGIGGRVAYDVSRWLTAEAELSVFPHDRIDLDMGTPPLALTTRYSRRRFEGFFGPKIGLRRERFGVFAKVRPGFAHLTDQGLQCVGEQCALALFARPEYRTEFALNFGGVFEFYPSPRTIARVDLGTTAIRHRSQAVPPCRDCTTENFSTSVGMALRF